MDNTKPNNPNTSSTQPNPTPNPDAPWLKQSQPTQAPAPKPTVPAAPVYLPSTPTTPPAMTPARTPTFVPAASTAPATPTQTVNAQPKPAAPLPKPVESSAKPPLTSQQLGPLQAPRWRVWLWRILVVLALLAASGLAFLLAWPSIQSRLNKPATTAATSTTPTTQGTGTETPSTGTVTTPAGTTSTTIPTPATTTTEEKAPFQQVTSTETWLGDAPAFFLNDEVILKDRNDPKRAYSVTAIEFTDSRCPKDVVCVWQGELGVRLRVKDMRTGQTEYVSLGMVRATTASVLGLRFDLLEIEDGKGGEYAQVRVK